MRALVIAVALAAMPAVASGADGGVADGGTIFTLQYGLDEQVNLQGGSQLAAGVDPTSGEEIVHPANLTELQAGLRKVGSAFQQGNGSAAVQFNPYLLLAGRDMVYHDVTSKHAGVERLLIDMSTSVALAAGSPYSTADQSRYSTLGLGFAWELLGNRSVFSTAFDECLNGAESQEKRVKAVLGSAPIAITEKREGETEEQYEARVKRQIAANPQLRSAPLDDAALKAVESEIVLGCKKRTNEAADGLYLSLGGRWVTPGNNRQDQDVLIRVHREFAGLAYELHRVNGLKLVVQGRVLAQRPASQDALLATLDLGGALQYASQAFAVAVEVVQAAYKFDDRAGNGSVAGTLKINLPRDVVLNLGLQGKGRDVGDAMHALTGTISISYRQTPLFDQKFDVGRMK